MIRIEHKKIEVTFISNNDLYFTKQDDIDVFPTHVIIGDDIFYFTIKDHAIIYTKSAIPALKALRIISNDDYDYLVYFLPNIHNYDTDNNETIKRG